MISPEGVPQVLEFNCRMGDPETQPIMMRLKSDLVDLLSAVLNGNLGSVGAKWDSRAALRVVIASGGYPGNYRKGATISGLESPGSDQVKVFHAGTAMNKADEITVSGGRVLCVTALGENIAASQHAAYDSIKAIHFEDMHFRTDIGARALDGTTTSTT